MLSTTIRKSISNRSRTTFLLFDVVRVLGWCFNTLLHRFYITCCCCFQTNSSWRILSRSDFLAYLSNKKVYVYVEPFVILLLIVMDSSFRQDRQTSPAASWRICMIPDVVLERSRPSFATSFGARLRSAPMAKKAHAGRLDSTLNGLSDPEAAKRYAKETLWLSLRKHAQKVQKGSDPNPD